MKINRLFDLQDYILKSYPAKEDLLAGKENGQWKKIGSQEYKDLTLLVANGLIEKGIKPGDKIATISNNRPEWNLLDMAIMRVGAIHVPIYPTVSESDYKYILSHAEVKLVFVEGKELLRKIDHILPQIPTIMDVYTFKKIDDRKFVEELLDLGRENNHAAEIENRSAAVDGDDVATLIYTSGTTGFPKGVMLSHQNIITDIMSIEKIPPVDNTSYALSFLPLCHVYERMLNYFYQFKGISIYYAESIGTITQDMQDVKPHIMTTVPRLMEKIYDKIMMKGRKLKGIQRVIFFWAIGLGLKYNEYGKNSLFYKLQLSIVDKLVFKKWRAVMGGRMRVMVSGGAALQERLARSFWAANIPVLEGYGLTETSPVIAVNHFGVGGLKYGTVGPPVSAVEVKIAEDGEILVKGSTVMKGYYKNQELTDEVIEKEGWFHTGDVGLLEKEGQLRITGRKKSIFKTSFGKYISPEHIENKIKESAFIDTGVVLGENQKFAAALIIPSFEHLKSWCKIKGLKYTTDQEMVEKPEIQKRIQREINTINEQLGDTEKIKRVRILGNEFSIATGEMTASLKLRRDFICNKYADIIEKLFV